jgi:TetR/AcrR family transcriptional regulator, cholesterol catabolism regulator
MDGFEKRREQKKNAVRRAAIDLFKSYGFRKVSIAEIARKAGVSQVTIYNYFDSKENLKRDVLKWFIVQQVEKYEEVMFQERPFHEKLEEIIFDKSNLIKQFQGEMVVAVLQEDPELRDFVQGVYEKRIIPAVMAFFKEGTSAGYIDPKFKIETILFYFEILRRGFFAIEDIGAYQKQHPDIFNQLSELVTYGLNG